MTSGVHIQDDGLDWTITVLDIAAVFNPLLWCEFGGFGDVVGPVLVEGHVRLEQVLVLFTVVLQL